MQPQMTPSMPPAIKFARLTRNTEMAQQTELNERLMLVSQQVVGLLAEFRELREDLRRTDLGLQTLTVKMAEIQAENGANQLAARIRTLEEKVHQLDLQEHQRMGSKDAGANIWKYTTGALALVLTALGLIIGIYLKTKGGQ